MHEWKWFFKQKNLVIMVIKPSLFLFLILHHFLSYLAFTQWFHRPQPLISDTVAKNVFPGPNVIWVMLLTTLNPSTTFVNCWTLHINPSTNWLQSHFQQFIPSFTLKGQLHKVISTLTNSLQTAMEAIVWYSCLSGPSGENFHALLSP